MQHRSSRVVQVSVDTKERSGIVLQHYHLSHLLFYSCLNWDVEYVFYSSLNWDLEYVGMDHV